MSLLLLSQLNVLYDKTLKYFIWKKWKWRIVCCVAPFSSPLCPLNQNSNQCPLTHWRPIQIHLCSIYKVIPLFLPWVCHSAGGPARGSGVWFQTQLVWRYLGGGGGDAGGGGGGVRGWDGVKLDLLFLSRTMAPLWFTALGRRASTNLMWICTNFSPVQTKHVYLDFTCSNI